MLVELPMSSTATAVRSWAPSATAVVSQEKVAAEPVAFAETVPSTNSLNSLTPRPGLAFASTSTCAIPLRIEPVRGSRTATAGGLTTSSWNSISTRPDVPVIPRTHIEDPLGVPGSADSVKTAVSPTARRAGSKAKRIPAGWPDRSSWTVPLKPEAVMVWTLMAMVLPAGSTARPASSDSVATGRSAATRMTTSSPGPAAFAACAYTYGSARAESGSVSGSEG